MEHQAADSKAEQMNRWLSSGKRPSDTVEGREAFDLVCRLHAHDALMRECVLKSLADPLEQSRRIAALADERNELAARLDAVCNRVVLEDVAAAMDEPRRSDEGATDACGWEVRKPQRYRGYAAPLYRLLVAAHREGKPRPTARDVVDAWRIEAPTEIAKMLPDGFDYYDAAGDTTTADLEAIRKAIGRMTNAR